MDEALLASLIDAGSPPVRATVRLTALPHLHQAGHTPEAIDFALPTHLHWDHISGLLAMLGLIGDREQPAP